MTLQKPDRYRTKNKTTSRFAHLPILPIRSKIHQSKKRKKTSHTATRNDLRRMLVVYDPRTSHRNAHLRAYFCGEKRKNRRQKMQNTIRNPPAAAEAEAKFNS